MVTDEVANPTFVDDLADGIVQLVGSGRFGIYHLTNAGYCSRYDYARHILDASGRSQIPGDAITLADYPRPSTPPKFSHRWPITAAAALGITLRPWEAALAEFGRLKAPVEPAGRSGRRAPSYAGLRSSSPTGTGPPICRSA